MQVQCKTNNIHKLDPKIDERLSKLIHLSDGDDSLKPGEYYAVQAIENWDGYLFYYLHTIEKFAFPHPYPAELFKITDPSLSKNWILTLKETDTGLQFKRATFSEWANNDSFFEHLVDSHPGEVAIYRKNKE